MEELFFEGNIGTFQRYIVDLVMRYFYPQKRLSLIENGFYISAFINIAI